MEKTHITAYPPHKGRLRRRRLFQAHRRCRDWLDVYKRQHGDKALINEPVFAKLAEKYGKTPAQIILRWHTQMGFIVIPGSKNPDHVRENFDIFDFKLTDDEMKEIAVIDKGVRYYNLSLIHI